LLVSDRERFTLKQKYKIAHDAYQSCVRALTQAVMNGDKPSADLLEKEANTLRQLTEARGGLLAAMAGGEFASAARMGDLNQLAKRIVDVATGQAEAIKIDAGKERGAEVSQRRISCQRTEVADKVNTERGNTDESLRIERTKTDQALVDRQAAVDDNADQIVEHARSMADAVLATARIAADKLLHAGSDERVPPYTALAEQRAAEDDVLQGTRDDADETVREQREESARVLAALLPLERQKTDRYLLTERARSDDALAHRDHFLGIVTHDLRDLLSGIVVSAALLPDDASGPNGTKQRIQRYAARMNRLIGDLLDVASIEAGQLKVVTAFGDWSALIEEVAALFEPLASARGITLELASAERSLAMRFDHDRMLQVLANLIANALKFTPRGGRIRVEVERGTDELRCAVHDTGSGIPAHMLEAVFQRFCQGRNNDRRGIGLGLYITRCIVEAHRGRIWAESIEGVGSTLRFSLPFV
jgi:signal transduction histidine kinase